MSERASVGVYFSDFFLLEPSVVESYGALNVSLVNDLPLFIDPFLLFDSSESKYQRLHDEIIKYLTFLRDVSSEGTVSEADISQWFHFKEVRQNWLGFSRAGNSGSGLGAKFAKELNQSLHLVFKDFGKESITKSSHLEKVCLFADGVGRDHLSDFTTNLIKAFLLDYTQTFALEHLAPSQRRKVGVQKVAFDYEKRRWRSGQFELPFVRGDYVILTPREILTRDAAWINRQDLLDGIDDVCESVPDAQLRAQINSYLLSRLSDDPSEKELKEAAAATVSAFPVLIDHFIKFKEDHAPEAHKQSTSKVQETQTQFIDQVRAFVNEHLVNSDFYGHGNTYAESMKRISFLKHVIENNDGWRLFYVKGVPVKQEADLQLLYRLTWFGTPLDVNREVNNGRGPVDYAVSAGREDKTLIEFKLARNTKLKRNLENQVATYEVANETKKSIKAILYFTDSEHQKVHKILAELKLLKDESIVLIDASPKESASLL